MIRGTHRRSNAIFAHLLPASHIWSARTLAPRRGLPAETPAWHRVLAGQTYGVHAVAFSPDGRQLASIARTARPGCGMGRQRER